MKASPSPAPGSAPLRRALYPVLACLFALLTCPGHSEEKRAVEIDAAFPGGNVLVHKVEADTVTLGPDQRDSVSPWFYWYYRVRGAVGRKLTFVLGKANVGVRGPAVSSDGGKTWNWMGAGVVSDGAFTFSFPAGGEEVRFCVGMPYLRADLESCLARHKNNPDLQVEVLSKTRRGREVPLVHIRNSGAKGRYAVAVTSRHHCCEMMASYVLEGLLEGVLAEDPAGLWLRANADFLFVPMMDLDGVEDGDQGKNRAPFDHNRDYAGAPPRYPEVAALKERLPAWTDGRPLVFLDLHDPALRTDIHEIVHFLEPEERDMAARMDTLCSHLERDQQGPILYRKAHNLRFGAGYNTHVARPSPLSAGWARSLPNTLLGCTVEIPYANAAGCEVNAHSGRELGRDMALALSHFLRDWSGTPPAK
jgi:hypothetical protein